MGSRAEVVPYVEYDENEAICSQCGSTFRSSEVLEAHVQESHAAPAAPAPPARARRVRCSVCGADLGSIHALDRHNRETHVS